MRGWTFALLVCAAGCAPDRYWVSPDDLAKARAAASPTVPAVRVDDNSPARAFVDELSPEAAPPRTDGRVMMIARPSQRDDVARPPSIPVTPPIMTSPSAIDWADARALAQRGRKRTIAGAILLGGGGGVFAVGFAVLLSYLLTELRDFLAPPDNPDNAVPGPASTSRSPAWRYSSPAFPQWSSVAAICVAPATAYAASLSRPPSRGSAPPSR